MVTTISKVEVARELLDRALELFLDDRAFVPAIVLAGAAEDVFHGYLQKKWRRTRTHQLRQGRIKNFEVFGSHLPRDCRESLCEANA